MGASAEHRDSSALQLTHHEFGVMSGYASVRKAWQIGIGDGDTLYGVGKVAKARAEHEADLDRLVTGALPDQGAQVVSVP